MLGMYSPTIVLLSPKADDWDPSPGRFMASSMMKLIIIYLVTNFDLQSTGIRQPNRWFGSLILPPGSATIRLKRRAIGGDR
jgi:hypothetical protein